MLLVGQSPRKILDCVHYRIASVNCKKARHTRVVVSRAGGTQPAHFGVTENLGLSVRNIARTEAVLLQVVYFQVRGVWGNLGKNRTLQLLFQCWEVAYCEGVRL